MTSGSFHHSTNHRRSAFTLTEVMVSLSLVMVLTAIWLGGNRWLRQRAGISVSTQQLHGLALANAAYALDHDGAYSPATSADNLTRWHGGRRALTEEFDPRHGFLSPYLGGTRQILTCPLLRDFEKESFEKGAGGYGYNAQYLGGTPENPFAGAQSGEIGDGGRTVMFATTALAVGDGIQEYPFTEPYDWVDRRGRPRGPLQPSTHFRANGKALVAWTDGSVSSELPNSETGPNFYGGNNQKARIGWFGPRPHNGYWNPNSPAARGIQP
ncbi:MAG: type II secretion system protein [Verrucomicrobiales bacterium]